MNITALTKLQNVYSDRDTDSARAVHSAVTAVLRLECRSPVVTTALECLVGLYEARTTLSDIERAERYLAECWAGYAPPTDGVVYKGQL